MNAKNKLIDAELRDYFSRAGSSSEPHPGTLQEVTFGEYLVDRRLITRSQLLEALQLQDRNPGVRLGECIAALGILPHHLLEESVRQWRSIGVVEI